MTSLLVIFILGLMRLSLYRTGSGTVLAIDGGGVSVI